MIRRPRNLKRVMQWLEQEGFGVYGPAYTNLDWAEEADGGCQDFTYEDIIRLQKGRARRKRAEAAGRDLS